MKKSSPLSSKGRTIMLLRSEKNEKLSFEPLNCLIPPEMDPKKTKASRRKYDSDFKNEVLKMVESGRPEPEIAQSLGIGNNLIYYWVKQVKKGSSKPNCKTELSFNEEKAALQK